MSSPTAAMRIDGERRTLATLAGGLVDELVDLVSDHPRPRRA